MRWEDERYIRLYTRDTPTWRLLPWQSKCVLPLLLRVLDRAGLMDLNGAGYTGVSALLGIPMDVVEPGMAGLVVAGVVHMDAQGLVVPNFLEAQECAHTDMQRQKESRAKRRAKGLVRVRAGGEDKWVRPSVENSKEWVTAGHDGSQRVTPNRAVPSVPSVKNIAGNECPPPQNAQRKKADPRLSPLQSRLEAIYAEVTGEKYAHGGARDAVALKGLLAVATDEAICERWRGGLTSGDDWLRVSTFAQLKSKWNNLRTVKAGGVDEKTAKTLKDLFG